VWVTRLEAALPRKALGEDLSLAPTDSQQLVDNWMQAGKAENDPCASRVVAPLGLATDPGDGGGPATRERTQQMLIMAGAAMMLAAIARRAQRLSMARTMR